MAHSRYHVSSLPKMELESLDLPAVKQPFKKIADSIHYINASKTTKIVEKVDLVLRKARFIDAHTLEIMDRRVTGQYIFIPTGTEPLVPPIEGLDNVLFLTNKNMFNLEQVPKSLTILGGGAIGCEMAQAFSRLGSKVQIIHLDPHLIPLGDPKAGSKLQE
jgi:pyruvate/2-oxoglutarate dehydrogenase complex dihydrolipoamide dehydrogenase (E3) component